MKNEFHISVNSEGKTAIDWLEDWLEESTDKLSRQKIKQAMQKGCVWLEKDNYTQRIRRAKKQLSKGDVLHCYYDTKVLETQPSQATLISDEGDYSIWNKPSGMFSQGSKWGDHCTINRWVEKNLQPERPAFIVHRLDRAASGLIILAHKKQVAAKFSEMFQQHLVEKHYSVIVEGDFSEALLEDETIKTILSKLDDKMAVSHLKFINYDKNKNQSLLDVQIETGRKHQIRKHLSGLGYPVVGDRLYGAERKDEDLQLKATSLKFRCPIKEIEKNYQI